MAIRITLECGHASVLRVRATPEGYTHDWEVFVRGVDNADIKHYVEKVIFHLHDSFPKPKRILKEPPYVVKESGYAGFVIPIDVCLKNKDEPKRIQILYDLQLQHSGPAINNIIRHSEVFNNPPDDFRRKLLKGGGTIVSSIDESHDRSESKVAVPMVGKPKLSGTEGKKHRIVEPKTTNAFADLFGTPIQKAKVSPEIKKNVVDKAAYHKTSPDKPEKSDKTSKTKHNSPHKDSKREKNGEEKKEKKDLSKEKDRAREKTKRPPSPNPSAPPKKQVSPLETLAIQKSASPKMREKDHKKIFAERDKDRGEKIKENSKLSSDDVKSDKKKKKHDKDPDRKEKIRDKERDKIKEIKNSEKKSLEKIEKHEKSEKDKSQDSSKSSKDPKKSPKPSKDAVERSNSKVRDKSDVMEKIKDSRTDKERQKHKHKKKDKKERTDESRERDKREKRDKKINYEKDNNNPTSNPPPNPLSTLLSQVNDRDSSDSASADEDDLKQQSNPRPEPEPVIKSANASESRLSRPLSPSGSEHVKRDKSDKIKKDKLKPRGIGDERDSRKRKRRSDSKGIDTDIPATKREKDGAFSPPLEPVSSSQSPVTVEASGYTAKDGTEEMEINVKQPEQQQQLQLQQQQQQQQLQQQPQSQDFETETEQIAPDSTNSILVESENDEPLVFSEDYVSQLKDLQQKIMTLQDNQELQRVVQVIAATGQYEITRKTFDFDLCALDRRTVQRLQQFFSAS